jgi:hypothetical protein
LRGIELLDITLYSIEVAKELVMTGIVPFPEIQAKIAENFQRKGLFLPFICTPEELIGGENE